MTFDDAYYRKDLSELPMTDETKSSQEKRVATYANATDVYQLFQNIDSGDGRFLLYSLTVYAFPTEADAISWIDDAQTIIESNPYYGSLQREEIDVAGADQTAAFRFGGAGDDATAQIILGQTGEVVHRIQLVPAAGSPPVPLTLGVELAEQQISCFSEQQCFAVSVPAGLGAYFEIPVASPVAA